MTTRGGHEEATGRIRVIKTPDGEAPEMVRMYWVGCELPCYPILGYGDAYELASKKPAVPYMRITVPARHALTILEAKHFPAARWYYAHGYPHKDYPYFCFDSDEIEIISGVTLQRLVEVTDEMQGDPNR